MISFQITIKQLKENKWENTSITTSTLNNTNNFVLNKYLLIDWVYKKIVTPFNSSIVTVII